MNQLAVWRAPQQRPCLEPPTFEWQDNPSVRVLSYDVTSHTIMALLFLALMGWLLVRAARLLKQLYMFAIRRFVHRRLE